MHSTQPLSLAMQPCRVPPNPLPFAGHRPDAREHHLLRLAGLGPPSLARVRVPRCRYSQKGGASSKGHFRRKYMFARPKYTAEKLNKIREVPFRSVRFAASSAAPSCSVTVSVFCR